MNLGAGLSVAALREILARLTRIVEAVEDGEHEFAHRLAADLATDLAIQVHRLEGRL